jgi:transposase
MGEKEPIADEEAELSRRHLLGLVLEFNSITDSKASQKLGVSVEQVRAWASELEKEGWISVSDELGARSYSLSKEGLSRIKDLKKSIVARDVEEKKEIKSKVPLKAKLAESSSKLTSSAGFFSSILRASYRDVVLMISTASAVYLLYLFVTKPNKEVLSFFFAVLMFSIVLLLYNQYKKHLKTAGFIGFVEWFLWMLKKRRRYIALIMTYILFIYVLVLVIVYPLTRAVNLIYLIVLMSTSVLIYYPKKNLLETAKFHIGMVALMYALLLLSGLSSITLALLKEQSRLFDVFIGFCIILLVQLNEDKIGVGVKSLQKMLREHSN